MNIEDKLATMTTDELLAYLPHSLDYPGVENNMLFLALKPGGMSDWWYAQYELAAGIQMNLDFTAKARTPREVLCKLGIKLAKQGRLK